MQETNEHIVELLYKHVAGEELEEEEQQALDAWLSESPRHRDLLEELLDEPAMEADLKALMAIDEDAALKKMQASIASEKTGNRLTASRIRYAAAVVLVLLSAAAVYSLWRHEGRRAPEIYHTISTQEKGNNQVVLPDSSRVWLNAASSLRFPVVFTGPERVVYLKGEAFFEVRKKLTASGAKIPMKVIVMNGERERGAVEVLGTRFNINAYADEATMNTTLVEGLVRLWPPGRAEPTVLQPGQEARLDSSGGVKLAAVDVTLATAWKDGDFLFRDTEIEEVMRVISRWYGVKVTIEHRPAYTFTGRFSKDLPLPKLLLSLEKTGDVRFSVDGGIVRVK